MLQVKNLTKIYQSKKSRKNQVVALNNVSIDFPENGLVFLLGKSGSGKSTLLNCIGGLDGFNGGEVIIKGKSSKDFSRSDFDSYRNTFIGFVFQEYNVLEEFSVAKNIALALELQGKKATKSTVSKLLKIVELDELADRKPNQLSGGQKQRVAIARALIKNPEIIMADEPTGALDSATGKQVMEILKRLSEKKLVIIVSHDREFAEEYGDRIIELKDGMVISDTTKKVKNAIQSSSGISYVDGSYVHIKKGHELTKQDFILINTYILKNASKGDTIISLDENKTREFKKVASITEDGDQEVFEKTTSADIVQNAYDGKNTKFIKSRLKFFDSFKMGTSALKNKVWKLIFVVLLSFVAFSMFGIVDTFASFDAKTSVVDTLYAKDNKIISITKTDKQDYYYVNNAEKITDEDIASLKSLFTDITFTKGRGCYGYDYYQKDEYNYYLSYNFGSDSYSYDDLYSDNINNVVSYEQAIGEFGLTLKYGSKPQNTKEACISEYIFNSVVNRAQSINDYNDFAALNLYTYFSGDYYKIVGVVADNVDLSSFTKENLQAGFMKANELYELRQESTISCAYVTESDFSSIYNNEDDYNEQKLFVNYSKASSQKIRDFFTYCEDDSHYYILGDFNVQEIMSFKSTIVQIRQILLYVGIGFAFFASLLLMNFISTSISYKRREIGILRALGARGSDVFKIFFNESLVIAFINFIFATAATFVATYFMNKAFYDLSGIMLLHTGVRQIILIFGISFVAAFISSIIPVSRFARKKPIDAINKR